MMKSLICLFFGMFTFVLSAQTDYDLAENYFNKGEFEKALILFQKLHTSNPTNSNLVFRIIEIQQELQHFDEAEMFVKSQLSTRNNLQMLVELGYNFQLQNKMEKAKENYQQAIDVAKSVPNYTYAIGLRFEEHSLVSQAIEVYKRALNQTQNPNYEYRLAGLYAEQKDVQNMFLSYLNFTENNPTYLNQVLRLFGDYISDQSDSEYNQILKKIVLKKLKSSSNIFWNQMLSWLYVQQQDFKKAFLLERSIFRRNNNSLQGIIDVGKMAKSAKNYNVTFEVFEYVIQNAQDSRLIIEANRQLLELELFRTTSPDLKQIKTKYNTLLDRYGLNSETVELQLSYADFLVLHFQQKPKAISFLKSALGQNLSPTDLGRIKLKLADILVANSQFNQALLYYAQVQTSLKNSTLAQEARFKSARTSYYKGDFDWAENQLKVLKASTSQLIANDALDLQLLITDHKFGDSLQTPLRLYAKADFLTFQNKKAEAISVLDKLISEQNTHAIVDEALLLQAELFESTTQHQKAKENYLRIIGDFSSEILIDDAHFALAELYRKVLDQPEQAIQHYEKIIFNHPDSIHFVESKKHFRNLREKSKNKTTIDL
ncbi:MAG: tetratricopeptide repeat protein [Bacteroidetes bacterium]|nr:tetratricopeptide repeat protein [Bacteroidota bacterium]MDA0859872.1 tetratricopeptide repeat protein [Bacteroidota bacterium]MDA1318917.1 tetratricopeptide repeat protein [Bacteroidota bacterium]